MKTIDVEIDNQNIQYQVESSTAFGGDEVMLDQDDNLLQNTSFSTQGYSVEPFLSPSVYEQLRTGLAELVWPSVNAIQPILHSEFALETIHKILPEDEKFSQFVLSIRDGYPVTQLPIPFPWLEERVSDICKISVTAKCPGTDIYAFYLRVVRPNTPRDHNPPHRDVWLNHLRNCVNIYLPIAGSNHLSSLAVLPGSHFWKESEIERGISEGRVNSVKYRVPAITATKKPFKMTRPNPGPNQILIFSPYLIHGGGANLNTDVTRVSLEMRFWRSP